MNHYHVPQHLSLCVQGRGADSLTLDVPRPHLLCSLCFDDTAGGMMLCIACRTLVSCIMYVFPCVWAGTNVQNLR